MRRVVFLACAVAAGFIGGLVVAGQPSVVRADEGVTSVAAAEVGQEVLWLTKGGSVYRCHGANESRGTPFTCVKQPLDFR
jgi:hypothetical protein